MIRKWGGPITLYIAVVLIATIGISLGPDHDKWWVPLLGGFIVVPVGCLIIMAVMASLDALWGYRPYTPYTRDELEQLSPDCRIIQAREFGVKNDDG